MGETLQDKFYKTEEYQLHNVGRTNLTYLARAAKEYFPDDVKAFYPKGWKGDNGLLELYIFEPESLFILKTIDQGVTIENIKYKNIKSFEYFIANTGYSAGIDINLDGNRIILHNKSDAEEYRLEDYSEELKKIFSLLKKDVNPQ